MCCRTPHAQRLPDDQLSPLASRACVVGLAADAKSKRFNSARDTPVDEGLPIIYVRLLTGFI
jgi:hypothetical protein